MAVKASSLHLYPRDNLPDGFARLRRRCSQPLQAQWVQPYSETGQTAVTDEQRQVVFSKKSTEYFGFSRYYLDGYGIIEAVDSIILLQGMAVGAR